MNQQQSYKVCILAGGEGRRFNGQDKGLIEYQGKPMVEHLIDAFHTHADEIIISANRNLDRYQEYNRPVVSDAPIKSAGPLAGTLAACAYCQTGWLLVVACDQPEINHTIANDMLSLARTGDSKLVITNDGYRDQPLPMLVDTSLQNTIESYLNSGDRKVAIWQKQQNALILKNNHRKRSININTPADL